MGGKTHPGVGARGTQGGSNNSERFLLLESSLATEGEEGHKSTGHTHTPTHTTNTHVEFQRWGRGLFYVVGAGNQIKSSEGKDKGKEGRRDTEG